MKIRLPSFLGRLLVKMFFDIDDLEKRADQWGGTVRRSKRKSIPGFEFGANIEVDPSDKKE